MIPPAASAAPPRSGPGRFAAVVRHELLASARERLPQVLLAVFLGVVAVSGVIGWLTRVTVTAVYNEALAEGLTDRPNPFGAVPELYYLRNTVIYIVLIGALLAIVLGVRSVLRDRRSGTVDLVLTRPISTASYLGAKLAGLSLWLAAVLAVAAAINVAAVSIILGRLPAAESAARMAGFYVLAWVFLLPFAVLGMLGGLYSSRETTALLVPIVGWAFLTFVLPQLGTAAHPVALLNPVAVPPAPGGFFRLSGAVFGPLSVTEHFKKAGGVLLQESQEYDAVGPAWAVLVLFALVTAAVLLATRRARLLGGEGQQR
jgi:ABC-2 type transport system permease protein